MGVARYAIVGAGVAATPEDTYERILLQVTGADLLIGSSPVGSYSQPKRATASSKNTYSVTLREERHRRWETNDGAIAITCGYDHRPLLGRYRFEVAFAPVFEFTSKTPLSLEDWLSLWVEPLLQITSTAIGTPQELAWLTLYSERTSTRAAVFSSGIAQEPYQARDETRRMIEHPPLFTFRSPEIDLPALLSSWREIKSGDNPFFELYNAALFEPRLPQRARFLHLIQALEALHSYESRINDKQTQRRFAAKRESLLLRLEDLGLTREDTRFLKRSWSTRRRDSLDHRLRMLIRSLPDAIRRKTELPQSDPVAAMLRNRGARSLEEQLRVLRNDLSHGDQNYEEWELRPWVNVLETLCRSHVLRLLGFDPKAIALAIAPEIAA